MERASPAKFSYPQRSLLALPIQQDILSKSLSTTRQSISLPTEYCLPAWSLEFFFSPRRIFHFPGLFPNGVIFSYRNSCSYHPQRKQKLILQHQPRSDFPAPVKDLLSQTKNTFIKHHIHHYSMHRRIISYKSRLCWEHHCLVHIMRRIWLTSIFQERFS